MPDQKMSAEEIRSIARGPVGAMVSAIAAVLICQPLKKKWAHLIPEKVGMKGRKRLLQENEHVLQIAKALSTLGSCAGVLCYATGWLSVHDWRGLGLGVGLTALLPLGYIAAVNARRGPEAIKECLITYAISQMTPLRVLFPLLAIFILAGFASAVSLILRP